MKRLSVGAGAGRERKGGNQLGRAHHGSQPAGRAAHLLSLPLILFWPQIARDLDLTHKIPGVCECGVLTPSCVSTAKAGGGGLGSYPDLVRDMLSQDVNAAISASKNLLAIAESTQVTEKLSVDVLSQLLQALRSPHTQVLCNITSIMFWVAYGNAENQRALIGLPNFLPAMAAIIRPKPGEQVVRQEQANAVHALSQVVFADADTAVSIVSTPGILSGMVSMMTIGASRPTARTARDIAALAVNNCAGIVANSPGVSPGVSCPVLVSQH